MVRLTILTTVLAAGQLAVGRAITGRGIVNSKSLMHLPGKIDSVARDILIQYC